LYDLKWQTLKHNGIAFPPPYEYRGLTVRVKNEKIRLDPLQEEMLMAWAKKKDTPYVQDPIFQRNFTADLKALGKLAPHLDYALADIDFTELNAIADREKTANLSLEEKKKRSAERKALRDELKASFGVAVIDGNEVEVGAYLAEPPGILMGRGNHPLRGRWKQRVLPKDVILNLDEDTAEPSIPDGHQWGKIVHDHDSMWIASWWDDLSKKRKYVWLAETSHLRQERDKEKYLKAAALESDVEKVREKIRAGMNYTDTRARQGLDQNEKKLKAAIKELNAKILAATEAGDKAGRKKFEDELALKQKEREQLDKRREKIQAAEMKTRQIATVSYLIDRLAMRVGDEKDEDEADTVGASTLRVEHILVGRDEIEFDFLGKDSVQWQKIISLDGKEQDLARNLKDLMQGKAPGDQIFDKVDSTHVNRFLSGIVPGLTAKVFRTFHATTTVRTYLRKSGELPKSTPTYEKDYVARLANLQAAIVCNHKRTPPKNWEQGLQNKAALVEKLRAFKPDLAKLNQQIPAREAALRKLIEQKKKLAENEPRLIEQKQATLVKLKARRPPEKKKQAAKLKKQIAAAEQAASNIGKDLELKRKRLDARIKKTQESLQKARQAPERAQRDHAERLDRASRQYELAKQTRDYNLGTSLKNYIDPRVYKSWGDYVDFDWQRLYTTALKRKFTWVNQSNVKWTSIKRAVPVSADQSSA
jgi:DNA topoisomerase I